MNLVRRLILSAANNINMAESTDLEEDINEQDINDEIRRLLDNKDAGNTKKITKLAYNVFGSIVDVAKAEENASNLDKALAKFYAAAKGSV